MRKISFLAVFLLLASLGLWAQARTLGEGTEIKVRTDTPIPAHPKAGARYTATVSDDVPAAEGGVAIPRGSRASLVAEPTNDGKDTVLDLRSVTVGGTRYNLMAAGGKSEGTGSLGANKRTAKYVGGGAVIGTVLGALLGGGKGAVLGGLAGGVAGGATQVYTGKKKGLPAETQLTYKLAQPLTLRAVGARSNRGLQTR